MAKIIEGAELSAAMWEVAAAYLPLALRQQVRPSKWNKQVWTLLADNASVANKLRHLLPDIKRPLYVKGFDLRDIEVKIAQDRQNVLPVISPSTSACPPDVKQRLAKALSE